MPQSLSMNLVHLINSTKNRDASLTPAIRSRLHAYQFGILKTMTYQDEFRMFSSRHRLEFDERYVWD